MYIPKELRAPLAAQFLAFMIVLMGFSTYLMAADNELEDAAQHSCVSRNVNRANSNELLNRLIYNAQKSKTYDNAEKVDRMASWAALRQPPEDCAKP